MPITVMSEKAASETSSERLLPPTAAGQPPQSAADSAGRELWSSEELMSGRSEVKIVHNGQVYRLRCTRQGKLILYK